MTDSNIDLTCAACERDGKGTYSLRVKCSNCGHAGNGIYSKGHEARTDECPRCGTDNLHPQTERWGK